MPRSRELKSNRSVNTVAQWRPRLRRTFPLGAGYVRRSAHIKVSLIALAALVACGVSAQRAPAEPFALVGRFDNVSSGTGEHCEGYSLDLWRSGAAMLGLLSRHEGLCGDPPCAAVQVRNFDVHTGRLSFRAVVVGQTIDFTGSVQGDAVAGRLNGDPVRLNRQSPGTGVFAPDTSVAEWCSFWQAVPRCKGVKEICHTLGR